MALAPDLRIHACIITDRLGGDFVSRLPALDVVTVIRDTPARIRNYLRRKLLVGTPADISRSYEITSSRTPWRFFVAMAMAGVLYKVSRLSPSAIAIWLVSIMAMETAFHALRGRAMRKSHGRSNHPILVIKHFMVYGSWAEKLFKPCEQHRAAEAGTGLGLAICRGLVDAMHGKIGYRKMPNGGATFWLKIPVARPAAMLPA